MKTGKRMAAMLCTLCLALGLGAWAETTALPEVRFGFDDPSITTRHANEGTCGTDVSLAGSYSVRGSGAGATYVKTPSGYGVHSYSPWCNTISLGSEFTVSLRLQATTATNRILFCLGRLQTASGEALMLTSRNDEGLKLVVVKGTEVQREASIPVDDVTLLNTYVLRYKDNKVTVNVNGASEACCSIEYTHTSGVFQLLGGYNKQGQMVEYFHGCGNVDGTGKIIEPDKSNVIDDFRIWTQSCLSGDAGLDQITFNAVRISDPWVGESGTITVDYSLAGIDTNLLYKVVFDITAGGKTARIANDAAKLQLGKQTRKVIDTAKLFGEEVIDANATVKVSLIEVPNGGVRLWWDGPVWAESNLGESEVAEHPEYGALYTFADAANAVTNLGNGWRLPTKEEFDKLINSNIYCLPRWDDDAKGWIFTGKSSSYMSNSIFLPVAGYNSGSGRNGAGINGLYWSSTVRPSEPIAYRLAFSSAANDFSVVLENTGIKMSVRAVHDGETFVSSAEAQFRLGPVWVTLPTGTMGYRYVVSNLTTGAEIAAAEGGRYALTPGTKVEILCVPEEGFDVAGTNPLVIDEVTDATVIDEATLPRVSQTVKVHEVVPVDPWDSATGAITVDFTVAGLEAASEYKVAFDVTANGRTVSVTNGVSELTSWKHARKVIETARLFGRKVTDENAKVKVTLMAKDHGPQAGQFWVDGPVWAASNLGAESKDDDGTLYYYSDAVKAVDELGDGWRMPSNDDFAKLIEVCTRDWDRSVNGWEFTGTGDFKGSSIFLPAAGYLYYNNPPSHVDQNGAYWTSTPSGGKYCNLFFTRDTIGLGADDPGMGMSVRVVHDPFVKEVAKVADEMEFWLGPVWVTLPTGMEGYRYVVSNLTAGAEIAATEGGTYMLSIGTKVGIYAVADEGLDIVGPNPYVIDAVTGETTVDATALPKVPPTVRIDEVKTTDPWDVAKGAISVDYTLVGFDPETEYRVAFDITATGKTASITNAAALLSGGRQAVTNIDTAVLFGETVTDRNAKAKVSVIAAEDFTAAEKEFWLGPGCESCPWKVTIGEHSHVVAAWTFGDGSVTNEIDGTVFGVLDGTENVKVVFSARFGWELTDGAAEVDIGTVADDITFGDGNDYKVPGVRRLAFVPYIDANGVEQSKSDGEYEVVTVDTRFLTGGWYAVIDDVDILAKTNITVTGDVHLILCDDASLTVTNTSMFQAAVSVGTNATLTIYGQRQGIGRLTAKGGSYAAGIGGSSTAGGHVGDGTGVVTIHGGTITANGGTNAAGIGGCYKNDGGSVTITGGRIAAAARSQAASDIGNGSSPVSDCTVSISGGVFANPVEVAWCAEGCVPFANADAKTAAGYPYAVLPGYRVSVGEYQHLTVSWTSGDGAVTNAVESGVFAVPTGTANVKVVFTVDPRYELTGEAVVNLGTLTKDITFGPGGDYEAPVLRLAPVKYVDADGEMRERASGEYTLVSSSTQELTDGNWYAVIEDITLANPLTVRGTAHLILCDWASLTVENVPDNTAAVSVGGGASLAIYGQEGNTGRLDVRGGILAAGIGGVQNGECGAIAIHGGTIRSRGGSLGAGIGSGAGGKGGSVTITDGRVWAMVGSESAADIGNGGMVVSPCAVEISGGVFARPVLGEWCAEHFAPVPNVDPATKAEYPYAVQPACTLTLDKHPLHMSIAWTSGDGEMTNKIKGTSCDIPVGVDVRVLYTADAGYALDGEAELDLGVVTGDVTFGVGNGFKVPHTVPTEWIIYETWDADSGTISSYHIEPQRCTLVTEETRILEGDGWHLVAYDVVLPAGTNLKVDGNANLIICDGASLTVTGGQNQAGVEIAASGSLTVMGQYGGSGRLTAQGGEGGAGIGSSANGSCGALKIYGGSITARGGSGAADIGAGSGGVAGTVEIAKGFFSSEPDGDWLMPNCVKVANPGEAAANAYPWTVIPPCQVELGAYANMTAAWTSGDGSETNVIHGESFTVKWNTENVKVIFTAAPGYVLDEEVVDLGTVTGHVIFGDGYGYRVPYAMRDDQSLTINEVKSLDPWESAKGAVTVDYSLEGLDAETDYKVVFDITAGGRTASVTNAAAKLADGRQTVLTNDTAVLFGEEVRDRDAKVKVWLFSVTPEETREASAKAAFRLGVTEVTLPTGMTGYRYVVSNLTAGVEIAARVRGAYVLPLGTKVGVYAVADEGYDLVGTNPYVIDRVTTETTIVESDLPKVPPTVKIDAVLPTDPWDDAKGTVVIDYTLAGFDTNVPHKVVFDITADGKTASVTNGAALLADGRQTAQVCDTAVLFGGTVTDESAKVKISLITEETVEAVAEREFWLGPVWRTLPTGKTGYHYVVSNLTAGVEIAAAEGGTYKLSIGTTVGIYAVADAGFDLVGENPYVIDAVAGDTEINEKNLPKVAPKVLINEVKIVDPWEIKKGSITVDYTLAGLDADTAYKVAFDITANGRTDRAVKDAAILPDGRQAVMTVDTIALFGEEIDSENATVKVSVLESKELGLQLWEGGPFWAEGNVGADENPMDWGGLYNFNDATNTVAKFWSGWRLPTADELNYLWGHCKGYWYQFGLVRPGVTSFIYGYTFNGEGAYSSNTISLPAGGWRSPDDVRVKDRSSRGNYWSSSSSYLDFTRYEPGYTHADSLDVGRSVRPVRDPGTLVDAVVVSAETQFRLGPVWVSLPTGMEGYHYVVSNLTTDAEIAVVEGGRCALIPGTKVEVHSVPDEGFVVVGTSPYVIDEVTTETTIDADVLPYASRPVVIDAAKTTDPWDAEKGTITIDYTLWGLDAATEYKVAFEITADGRTASVTNDAARLSNGRQIVQTNDTAVLFGEEVSDANAKVKVSLIAVPSQAEEALVASAEEGLWLGPVWVTLPKERTGYHYVVTNLMTGAEIAKREDGKYAFVLGTKVGIYAAPEDGYRVADGPYVIDEVTADMTIDAEKLPKVQPRVVINEVKTVDPWVAGRGSVAVDYTLAGFDTNALHKVVFEITADGKTVRVANDAAKLPDGRQEVATLDTSVLFGEEIDYTNAKVKVSLIAVPASGVQLWKDGPVWAESNLGESEDLNHSEYGALYNFDEGTAATAALGGWWRRPNEDEYKKLIDQNCCSREWNGSRKGWTFTGKGEFASNSIFLPAAGYSGSTSRSGAGTWGYYWSSTHRLTDPTAYYLGFSDPGYRYPEPPAVNRDNKSIRMSVRAVHNAEVSLASEERDFCLGPVWVTLPTGMTGYHYVVSNLTTGAEIAAAEGGRYALMPGTKVEIRCVAEEGYVIVGTNPYVIDEVTGGTTVDAKDLAKVAPKVVINEARTADPWAVEKGTVAIDYTLGGLDAAAFYKVVFDITADDRTASVTNAPAKLPDGRQTVMTIDTAVLFGEGVTDDNAKVRVSLIAEEEPLSSAEESFRLGPVWVTLPAGTSSYGYVVSNLTTGAEIAAAEGGRYALILGTKVEIRCVAEEGYAIVGENPYVIEEVADGTTIDASELPKVLPVTINAVQTIDPWDGEKGAITIDYTLANLDAETLYKVSFEITADGRTASVTNDAAMLSNGRQAVQTNDTAVLFGEEVTDRNAKVKVSLIAVQEPAEELVGPPDETEFWLGPVWVTLPTGLTSSHYVVSNLTRGVELEVREDGRCALMLGTKVGVYAVAEEGYVIVGENPYVIDAVTDETVIDASELPKVPPVKINAVQTVDPWDAAKGAVAVDYTLADLDAETEYKVAFEITAGSRTAGVTNVAAKLPDGRQAVMTVDTITLFGKEVADRNAKLKVTLIAVNAQAEETVAGTDETSFWLGPVWVTLPTDKIGYHFVVSNLTTAAEIAAAEGGRYALIPGTKVGVYAVPEDGFVIVGTNPYVIEKVTSGTTIDESKLPKVPPTVRIDEVVTTDPWEGAKGTITVDYTLAELNADVDYQVMFDITADGKTARVMNDLAKLTMGKQPQKTIETAKLFGAEVSAENAKVKVSVITKNFETPCVQLWENGPYWAECNIGAESEDIHNRHHSHPEAVSAVGNLGDGWRLPTKDEFDKLIKNCEWKWTTTPENGMTFTGKGAYSTSRVFLPADGYDFYQNVRSQGAYWTSTPVGSEYHNLWFTGGDIGVGQDRANRYMSVRAVNDNNWVTVKVAGEAEFRLGPVWATLPSGMMGYHYVVSNLTTGVEIAAAEGGRYALILGTKVAVYAVAEEGYAIVGTNPYVIEEVTGDTAIDAKELPKVASKVLINEVKTVDPWDDAKGTVTVDYTLAGLDADALYKVAFEITADGQTAGVTNAAAKLSDGRQTVAALDTIALFGEEVADNNAKIRVSLIAEETVAATADESFWLGPVWVTLPTDMEGYHYVVSNLTTGAEIAAAEGGRYALMPGTKVGIYVVLEEGYTVVGENPYVIEEVTGDTAIDESKLPKAVPMISIDEVVTTDPWEGAKGTITVDYTLAGFDANVEYAVTFDITANGKTASVADDWTKLTMGKQPQRTFETAKLFGAEVTDKNAKVKVSINAKVGPQAGQLWENGPIWAECNIGADLATENGTLYKYSDAVNAVNALGDGWRLPTKDEFEKLINTSYCTSEWGGTPRGRTFTGSNGEFQQHAIFLPAAGYFSGGVHQHNGISGSYWSSSPGSVNNSYHLFFDVTGDLRLRQNNVTIGMSVRVVKDVSDIMQVAATEKEFWLGPGCESCPWTVTIGEYPHMSAAWTSGDGSETNEIDGTSFRVVDGTENVRVIFTAESGRKIVGEAVVALGTVTGDVIFGVGNDYKVPYSGVLKDVAYLDWDPATESLTNAVRKCVLLDGSMLTLENDWYAVEGEVVIPEGSGFTVVGAAHLVLCDGASLTIANLGKNASGIVMAAEAGLTVYGQSVGSGVLTVIGGSDAAGIQGGTLTICGGEMTAVGGKGAAGVNASVAFAAGFTGGVFAGEDEDDPKACVMTPDEFAADHSARYVAMPRAGLRIPQVCGLSVIVSNETEEVVGVTIDGMNRYVVANGEQLTISFALQPMFEYASGQSPEPISISAENGLIVVDRSDLPAVRKVSVSYLDWDEELRRMTNAVCRDYEFVTDETREFQDGVTYVVWNSVETWEGVVVNGAARLILCDGASYAVFNDYDYSAGIRVLDGDALVICGQELGTGSLEAGGGYEAAGIGGDEFDDCGTVTINGGMVSAYGGNYGAGIGGGHYGCGGTVTINGGIVFAAGGYDGAGIGGGCYGRGGTVTINCEDVTAYGGEKAAGIGAGYDCDDFGTVVFGEGLAGGVFTGAGDDDPEECVLTRDEFVANHSARYVTMPQDGLMIPQLRGFEVVVSNETEEVFGSVFNGTNRYVVASGDGLTIYLGLMPSFEYADGRSPDPISVVAENGLTVIDSSVFPALRQVPVSYLDWDEKLQRMTNAVCREYELVTAETGVFDDGKTYVVQDYVERRAGVVVNGAARLILCDDSSFSAAGGSYRAGISVESGNTLVICGQEAGTGQLEAFGGEEGCAGIGGGCGSSCGAVTINGGTVVAMGDDGGAGIGGGVYGGAGTVTINGGTVVAAGTFSDETVVATAAIGDGTFAETKGSVRIAGGRVVAIASDGVPVFNEAVISGGLFNLTSEFDSGWLATGYWVTENDDAETKDDYPYAVVYSPDKWQPVRFARGEHVLEIAIQTSAQRAFVALPDDGRTNLVVGATVRIHVTTEDGYYYLGATEFTVGEDGLDVVIDASDRLDPVDYLDWNETTSSFVTKTCSDYELVTHETTVLTNGGWYAVRNAVVINSGTNISVEGSAHLILCDGASLKIESVGEGLPAIEVTAVEGDVRTLAIHGQENGTGRLQVTGGYCGAGIGGGYEGDGGAVIVGGGTVMAMGGVASSGIGGGAYGNGGLVAIVGGTLTAKGGFDGGSGIGGGYDGDGGDVVFGAGFSGGVRVGESEDDPEALVLTPVEFMAYHNVRYVTMPRAGLRIPALEHLAVVVSNVTDGVEIEIVGKDEDGASIYDVEQGDRIALYFAPDSDYEFAEEPAENPMVFDVDGMTVIDRSDLPTAQQVPVPYLDWDEGLQRMTNAVCRNYESVSAETREFKDGVTYVLRGRVENATGGVTVDGAARLILCDGASYSVVGESEHAGIQVVDGNGLVICGQEAGTGSLTARGGSYGAGIGGGNRGHAGAVTINGGQVLAHGGRDGAGIGGGYYGHGAAVTVNGGVVTATGNSAAALGAGFYGSSAGTVRFGTGFAGGVFAGASETDPAAYVMTSDEYAVDHSARFVSLPQCGLRIPQLVGVRVVVSNATEEIVGASARGTNWYVVASGEQLRVYFDLEPYCAFVREPAANPMILAADEGVVTLGRESLPTTTRLPVPYLDWDEESLTMTNALCHDYEVVTATTGRFEDGITYVVLNQVENATGGVTVNGSVRLVLCDGASFTVVGVENKAGVRVPSESALTVCGQEAGTGSLVVTGGRLGAGIGSDYQANGGAVTINGGQVLAHGGRDGAGIGGGNEGDGGEITINGGTVTATGGRNGAGIGGGYDHGDCKTVTINGGTVTARSENGAAGIGGGNYYGEHGTVVFGDRFAGGVFVGRNENDPAGRVMTTDEFEADHTSPYVALPRYGLRIPQTTGIRVVVSNATEEIVGVSINGTNRYVVAICEGLRAYFGLEPSFLYIEEPSENPMIIVTDGVETTIGLESLPKAAKTPIPYLDWDDELKEMTNAVCRDYELVTAETGVFEDGKTYVVQGQIENLTDGVDVRGAARLILCDGASFTVVGKSRHAGIQVADGNSLIVFGQESGTGSLTATGGEFASGLGGGYEGDGGTVTINGGQVLAMGGYDGAGIGGGSWRRGGAVTVNGGTVMATGGLYGAGIGGGNSGYAGVVTINGGLVTATGGDAGAGIGGGDYGDGGTVTINGGTVTATGGLDEEYGLAAAAIGSGCETESEVSVNIVGGRVAAFVEDDVPVFDGEVAISGGIFNVEVALGCLVPGCWVVQNDDAETKDDYPYAVVYSPDKWKPVQFTCGEHVRAVALRSFNKGPFATLPEDGQTNLVVGATVGIHVTTEDGYYYLGATEFTVGEDGLDVVIEATDQLDPVDYLDWDEANSSFVTKTCSDYELVTHETTVLTNGGWYAVRNAVVINSGNNIRVEGSAHLILCDGASLTIESVDGELAAIEVAYYDEDVTNELTICGQANGTGHLKATGGDYGAGIGGGDYYDGGTVTINGGTVTAKGGECAAGIGGGYNGYGATVTINGGTVTARGGYCAAGIGGGYHGYGATVTINGGTVTATGGCDGAGIGGGYEYDGGTVTINGGTVTAIGDSIDGASGIGCGYDGCWGGEVTINGGTVTTHGGCGYPGIGGVAEEPEDRGLVTITDGRIDATADSEEERITGEIKVSGGVFSRPVELPWLVPGFWTTDNDDVETKLLYPYMVVSDPSKWPSVRFTAADDTIKEIYLWCFDANLPVKYQSGEATNLVVGTTVGIYVVTAEGHHYLGETVFTVGEEGLDVTLETDSQLEPIDYLEWDPETKGFVTKTCTDYTPLTVMTQVMTNGGWYAVVNDFVGPKGWSLKLEASAHAHLILCDGTSASIAASDNWAGILVSEYEELTICGQSAGTGVLTVTGGDEAAGIGGSSYCACGVVTINGGMVTARGGNAAAAIGGGWQANGGDITINGGTVTADCADTWGGAGIGGASSGDGGSLTVNGGTVTAIGGGQAAGIGGGCNGAGPEVVINAGTVMAKGGSMGAGIGGGSYASGGTVTINGGTVTAQAGDRSEGYSPAAAIGFGAGHTGQGFVGFGDQCLWVVRCGDNPESAVEVPAEEYCCDHSAEYVQIEPATEGRVSVGEKAFAVVGDNRICTIFGEGSATNFPAGFDRGSFTNAVVADGITEIGEAFFFKCRKLNAVTLGKDVAKIGANAFLFCLGLEKIEIRNPDFDTTQLEAAISYHTAIKPDGSLYPIPDVTISGYEKYLEGKVNLTDANWANLGVLDPAKPMEEYGDYKFFRIILKKIVE